MLTHESEMKSKIRLVALALVLFSGLLYACDENRIYEKNKDIPEHSWHKDSVLIFDVKIEDPAIPYHVYYNIRNAVSYPTQNLYLRIEVQDTTGRTLTSDLNNIELFDSKTGKPFGDGLGDIFDHQVKVLDSFMFPDSGLFKVEVQHRMRDKILVDNKLPHIMSVGIRVEKAATEETE